MNKLRIPQSVVTKLQAQAREAIKKQAQRERQQREQLQKKMQEQVKKTLSALFRRR